MHIAQDVQPCALAHLFASKKIQECFPPKVCWSQWPTKIPSGHDQPDKPYFIIQAVSCSDCVDHHSRETMNLYIEMFVWCLKVSSAVGTILARGQVRQKPI
ncbi:hypothetical protein CEXT_436971 [Caerostris extrusa]|uniref:Uncharacterized protein n=1 Tax=Caerostris extrusa TaxID=172846 RepID=A0AAV4XH98_CAEEX|nr:hypothetical protein CEXT_436971 [Caerostris extrusa]